jgi:PilZ domain
LFTRAGAKRVEVADSSRESKPAEARRSKRARTFLQARISYGDGAISTECTVNQLSDIGARINIAGSIALPDMFDIIIPQKGASRRAKLVWRKDDQVGVDFFDERETPSAPAAEDYAGRIKMLEAENAKLRGQIGALLQQVHRLTED